MFWEALYQSSDQKWSGRPNAALVNNTAGLEPGTALDLGSGEGGDAIWLAEQGWLVTAVDIAPSALARSATAATAAGVSERIRWVQADLAVWHPQESFDLVTAHFLQSPVELPRDAILRRAAAAVAPGGTLLVVGHAEFPPGSSHAHSGEVLPTPDDVLASLQLTTGEWLIIRCAVAERTGTLPDGTTTTFVDSVLRVRRVLPAN
ncbi:MAG: class I SAM-dependent methyltransferase [Microbacteriaceae bacterium]|nr:class I SAM-dependent methyltransferase [Microbacteriaceae bacterium]